METTAQNLTDAAQHAKETIQQTATKITGNQNVGSNERIISAVAGIALTIYGLKNKETTWGKALSVAGSLLLSRATTGYCPLNQAMGRSSLLPSGLL